MVTVSASTFKALFNVADFTEEHAEEIIDLAIHAVNNISKADLSNMTGTAGSKTVNLESEEVWAVLAAAYAIYNNFYKGRTATATHGQSISIGEVMGNPTVMDVVERAARQLAELDVSYG
jgi:hypothetical protein